MALYKVYLRDDNVLTTEDEPQLDCVVELNYIELHTLYSYLNEYIELANLDAEVNGITPISSTQTFTNTLATVKSMMEAFTG